MLLELLLIIGLPLLIGLLIWGFFYRDLQYFRQIEKLKVGELEALIERHRRALILHFLALALLLPLLIFYLGGGLAIVEAILLAATFLGHVSALSQLSRPLIASLKSRNAERLHLQSRSADEAFVEELEKARQRLND